MVSHKTNTLFTVLGYNSNGQFSVYVLAVRRFLFGSFLALGEHLFGQHVLNLFLRPIGNRPLLQPFLVSSFFRMRGRMPLVLG